MKATSVIIGSLIGAVLGIPAVAYLLSPSALQEQKEAWLDLGQLAGFPLNSPTLFQFTRTVVSGWEKTAMSYGAFVLRQDRARVRAFSNICTHLGCRVLWHPDIQNYVSPCHDGHFDAWGNVVSGPPPRPLDEFKTRIEAGHLYVQLPPRKRNS